MSSKATEVGEVLVRAEETARSQRMAALGLCGHVCKFVHPTEF